MLRKVLTLSMVLAGLLVCSGTITAASHQELPTQNDLSHCTSADEIVQTVLKQTAKELDMPLSFLIQKYDDGVCTINQVDPKTYKVALGGVLVQVVLDTL